MAPSLISVRQKKIAHQWFPTISRIKLSNQKNFASVRVILFFVVVAWFKKKIRRIHSFHGLRTINEILIKSQRSGFVSSVDEVQKDTKFNRYSLYSILLFFFGNEQAISCVYQFFSSLSLFVSLLFELNMRESYSATLSSFYSTIRSV